MLDNSALSPGTTGKEFNENKKISGGMEDFSNAQVHVPFILYYQIIPVCTHRTSHYDVKPTLM
ncbi:MAG: hypothetical protein ACLU4N_03880 [Butyricimonas faecihominis]